MRVSSFSGTEDKAGDQGPLYPGKRAPIRTCIDKHFDLAFSNFLDHVKVNFSPLSPAAQGTWLRRLEQNEMQMKMQLKPSL